MAISHCRYASARRQPCITYHGAAMAGLNIESENSRVQRLGGARRIKILAQKSDLSLESTQEDHIILAINATRGFYEPLRL